MVCRIKSGNDDRECHRPLIGNFIELSSIALDSVTVFATI
jgi:hypothetical protein